MRCLAQFGTNLKKHEKHPWRGVTFKVKLLHGCFSRFFTCEKWYQTAQMPLVNGSSLTL